MGAKHSCLINDIYIGDYEAHEAPIPARPLSQQQLTTRRQALQLEYSNSHGPEVPQYRRQRSQLRRQSLRVRAENEHQERNARFDRDMAQPQPQRAHCALLRSEDGDEEDLPRFPRQSSRLQLPRRQRLSLEHEYGPDILRQERHAREQRPAQQREDEIEAVIPPVYEDRMVEHEDQSSQGGQDGGGGIPPRYEDHIFDRRVDDNT